MEIRAYFFDIHKVIINHLKAAKSEIVVAIAWFTDQEIFETICTRARLGVKVAVILIGDNINQGAGRLNFAKLDNLGGKVIFLAQDSDDAPIMHNKFCVIDQKTVITGSYNWSKKARSNEENITVVEDAPELAYQYRDAFQAMLTRAGYAVSNTSKKAAVNPEAVRRRLELIRNLVLLGESEEIAPHIRKLSLANEILGLGQMIAALESGAYSHALELIDDYLHQATALIVADDANIARLRFELSVLELRLESLSDEKAELDRRLIRFNLRYDEALGDLIQRLLRARAHLAGLKADNLKSKESRKKDKVDDSIEEASSGSSWKQAEEEAAQAEKDYSDYSQQHEALREEASQPLLSEEDERTLKSIYRKACALCHPDKFPEEQKARATEAFIDLQTAYKRNELPKLREIYEILMEKGLPNSRSSSLREVDSLKAAIAELKHRLAQMATEIVALRASDAFQMVEMAGQNEADWPHFFKEQSQALEAELVKVEAEIEAEIIA